MALTCHEETSYPLFLSSKTFPSGYIAGGRASLLFTFYHRSSQSSWEVLPSSPESHPIWLQSCPKKSFGKIVEVYMPVIIRGVSRAGNQPFFPGRGKEEV